MSREYFAKRQETEDQDKRRQELEAEIMLMIADSEMYDRTVAAMPLSPSHVLSIFFAMLSGNRELQVALLRKSMKYISFEAVKLLEEYLELIGE